MDCPVCKIPLNSSDHLEPQLIAKVCKQCSGHWVNSYQYWKWRDYQKEPLPRIPPNEEDEIIVKDSNKAKLCPECGHFLRSSRVGHGLNFALDRCANCGGFWFDKNEWAALRQAGLHLDTHSIFTKVWQREVKQNAIREDFDRIYSERFGRDDYSKIKRIRNWIQNHPKKDFILRYIFDEDPYSI